MIEREFIKEKKREFQVEEFIRKKLGQVGFSKTQVKKTPLGEKIEIHAAKPGLVVGKKGANIMALTENLKKEFKFENPQIETVEVKSIFLDPSVVAETIANSLEQFGSAKFKAIGHKMLENVMRAGAKGIEILISGKIPSSRAKTWRFYAGYIKKCGDAAYQIPVKYSRAELKTGTVGIQVRIVPPDLVLPDNVEILDTIQIEEVKEEKHDKKEKKKSPKKKEEVVKKEKPKKAPQNKSKEKKTEPKHTKNKQAKKSSPEKQEEIMNKEEKPQVNEEEKKGDN